MTFRVRIDPVALRQIEQFAAYLRDYSEEFAIEQIERLDRILSANLRESPLTWAYFAFTGAPYRAYHSASVDGRNIGSSIPWTRTLALWTFFNSGMR
jgi:hypothetical protein